MTLFLALTIAVLFGAGTYLMLKRDLVRVVAGVTLMTNAANLFLMGSALTRGAVPIYPLPEGRLLSDPLVQALTLTAIVINFGSSGLLLSIVYRIYTTHGTIDQEAIGAAERADELRFELPAMVEEEVDLEEEEVGR